MLNKGIGPDMSFKGNVESFSLADVFQNLAMNAQTGTLRVTPEKTLGAEEKYVYFQDGQLRFLSRSSRAPLLPPEVFVARALVSKSEFDAALLKQAETSASLNACLLSLGFVNEQQVQDVLIHQIEEEIYDLFGWEAAAFEFNEGSPPEGLFAAEAAEVGWGISLQVSHLIMEAARRVDEWERLRKVIPSQKEIFVVDLSVRKAIERGEMETDPVERRVAMLVDGARDVEDVVEDSRLFKFEVYGALAGFLQSSVIRPATLNELNFSEGECSRLDLPKRRVKVLERILALGGENLRIRRELADLMAKMGQIENACIHYNVLAAAELKEGREDGAVEIYKRILAIAPANAVSRDALAHLYARRGQKRDAFNQYSELFENLRDQHQIREAREAAVHALQNDPGSAKMRNSLIELLLMDDMREEAADQLEQLGDYAARSRNSGVAADAYRRAMQYRKNGRPLKKKLNEVLLTKEDRVARRRRAMLMLFCALLLLAAGAALAWHENENKKKFEAAELEHRQALETAEIALKNKAGTGELNRAVAAVEMAMQRWKEPLKLWSPLMGYKGKAGLLYDELAIKEEALKNTIKNEASHKRNDRDDKRDDARRLFDKKGYFQAQALFKELVGDAAASPDEKAADRAQLDAIDSALKEYNDGLARLALFNQDPLKAFPNGVREELRFILDFKSKFGNLKEVPKGSGLKEFPKDLKLPIQVKSSLDEVKVWLDDKEVGTVKNGAQYPDGVFRYPLFPYEIVASHRFKFVKDGYNEQVEDTLLHQTPENVVVNVDLKRLHKFKVQLPNARFDGDACVSGDSLFVGTADGSLLEIGLAAGTPGVLARYDLRQIQGGVDKQIYGKIHVHKAPGKTDLLLYCTKAGYCVGLRKNGEKLESVWPSAKIPETPQNGLEFPPAIFTQDGKPMFALMTQKKIILVDGETGAVMPGGPQLELPSRPFFVSPTSAPCFVNKDGGMLVAGCSDGNLYAFSLGSQALPKKWETGQTGKGFFIRVAPFVVDDLIVAAGNVNEGTLIPFKASGERMKEKHSGGGAAASAPLIRGFKVYLPCDGTAKKEGLTFIDFGAGDRTEPRTRTDVGVALTPAMLEQYKRVYYISNNFHLHAIDAADISKEYWEFEIGRKVSCPPVTHGNKVYVLDSEGTLYVFDEPS